MSYSNIEKNIDDFLLYFPRPVLVRTHTAYCPFCGIRTSTSDPYNRSVSCFLCDKSIIIQKNIRCFLICVKRRKLKQREMLFKWLLRKNVSAKELVRIIALYM